MPLNLAQKFTGATTYPNAYANTPAAFLPAASVLSLYATTDLNAATDTVTLGLTVNQGGTAQVPIPAGYVVGAAEGANQGPVVPDDVVLAQYGLPSQSALTLSVSATAALDVLRLKTFITP